MYYFCGCHTLLRVCGLKQTNKQTKMSAKLELSERELMYLDVCNYYINGISTLVVNCDYYLKLIKFNLIDHLPFNLIVKK